MSQCSTHTTAFKHNGIADGTELIARTHYTLAENEALSPEPTGAYVDQVAKAFRRAYIREADVPLVPDPVTRAIEHAMDRLAHRLLDDPDADLRTELLPSFYQSVATAYCAHLAAGGDTGEVGIWYDEDDEDGGIPVERP